MKIKTIDIHKMPAMSIAIARRNRYNIHHSMLKYRIEIKKKEYRSKMNIFQKIRYYRNKEKLAS